MQMLYFGDKLKALRTEKGWTQQQLADRLELVNATISAYEQSAKSPSVEVLIKICGLFNVSADYLLGLSDNMERKMSVLTDEQMQMIVRLITEFEQHNLLKERLNIE